MHQNDFWSWSLAKSFCMLFCTPSFPHSFVDEILSLCIWFPSLVKVCFSAAFPLCPSTASSLLFPLFCAAGYPDGFLRRLCILCTDSLHYNNISFPHRGEHLSFFQLFISVKGFLTAILCSFQLIWFYSVWLNFPAGIHLFR